MRYEFNPDSLDARLATLITNQERFERETYARLDRIEQQTTKTNGRVSNLEQWRTKSKAQVATVVSVLSVFGGVASWIVSDGLHKFLQ